LWNEFFFERGRSIRRSLDGAMARRLAAGLLLPLLSGCSIAVSLYVVNRSAKPVLLEYSCIQLSGTTIIAASRLRHGRQRLARARLAPAFVEGRVDSVLVYRVIIPRTRLSVLATQPPRKNRGPSTRAPTGAHGASPSSRVKTQSVILVANSLPLSHNIEPATGCSRSRHPLDHRLKLAARASNVP